MPRRCRLQNMSAILRGLINKAGPFVGSIMETILRMQMISKTPCRRRWIVTNGLMCGSTVRKFHDVAIRKSKSDNRIVRVKWCSHF